MKIDVNSNLIMSFTTFSLGLGGPVGALFDLAHAGADRLIAGIDKSNTCPALNECKFNITHHGKHGINGFRTKWFTIKNGVKSNDERLDGLGHQVDTSQQKISGELSLISFRPYGESCIKSITTACGAETLPSPSYIKITYQQMIAALKTESYRDHVAESYRDRVTDTDHGCARFSNNNPQSNLAEIHIDASIFQCGKNDQQCITSHLEMH